MFAGDERPFQGAHYQLDRPLNSPAPLHRPRILVGGGGEKKTLKLVARYADACNVNAPTADALKHKLDILRAHCDTEGRDYAVIEKTTSSSTAVEEGWDGDAVVRQCEELRALGVDTVFTRASSADPRRLVELVARDVLPRLG
jgi:alkanesulfonate monooxygenase SsuD/methylene tetrahydromethanopterin reductase-like flavin-dependent oxidoreductase (luciferase family)